MIFGLITYSWHCNCNYEPYICNFSFLHVSCGGWIGMRIKKGVNWSSICLPLSFLISEGTYKRWIYTYFWIIWKSRRVVVRFPQCTWWEKIQRSPTGDQRYFIMYSSHSQKSVNKVAWIRYDFHLLYIVVK